MRTLPKEAPPHVGHLARSGDVRTYRFLTPVFGGGVNVKESDPLTPVRVASIRGQLRFWWRAVNPRGCTTAIELRRAEATVFGSTDKASSLVIRVNMQLERPSPLAVFEGKVRVRPGMDAIAYGAFPLRDGNPDKHGVLHDFGEQTFELAFTYPPEIEDDVHAALWAWAHFGALGGRTRRGFGAIAQVSPEIPTIDDGWARFVKTSPAPWPHLGGKPVLAVVKSGTNDGMAALDRLLGVLHKIRQGPNVGRRADKGKAHGRSFWPEPDSIRRAFPDQVGKKHETRMTEQDCFPRAAFGTPIIFHFKQPQTNASREEKEYAKDPRNSTLMPEGKHRLASRLVLRPHLGIDGQVAAMVLVLAHPLPAGGYVLVQDDPGRLVAVQLKKPLSLGDDSTLTDPIERFLEELCK